MVDSLSAKDFTATADFKDMSQTNAIPIYVTLNDTKYASKLDWSLDVKNVRVALEDVLSKEFQITVEQTGETAQNFTIGNFILSEKTVMVKAPVSIMQMINKAVVEVDVKGINKDFTKDLNIKLLSNTNTEIKINEKNVQVSIETITVNTNILPVKEVDIAFSHQGLQKNGYIFEGLTSDIEKIKIKGDDTLLSKINEIKIPSEIININNKTESFSVGINIKEYLPEGVEIYGDIRVVNITANIKKAIIEVFELPINNIEFINIPAEFNVKYDVIEEFLYTIKGSQEDIETYDYEKAKATIDMKSIKEGLNKLDIKLVIDNKYEIVTISQASILATKKLPNNNGDNSTPEVTTSEQEETTTNEETDLVEQDIAANEDDM